QDAAAMYSYAGASAAATTLTPFTQPPPTTTNGAAAQTAALPQAATGTAQSTLAQMAAIPNLLQTLSTGGSFDPVAWLHTFATSPVGTAINRFGSDFGNVATEFSGVAFVASGITPFFVSLYPLALPASAAAATSAVSGDAANTVTAASASAGLGDGAVTAGVGDAAAVGKLSVPPAWGNGSSPAIRLAALDVPSAGVQGVPQGQIGGTAGYYGLPPMGGLVNAPRGDQLRSTAGERHKVIPALARDMNADDAQARQSKPPQTLRNVVSALSEGERDELDKLRREIAELATERDAAARLVKEALW
ncbi:PE/PPE C-terminal domain-containing protein, partial [Mycobacterium asiaticum]|uniref:PE/PPE C-terminal domain-containing protein n=1 Tax=Mycobacterium asiaticum TaxID=1790 RepID=UPI0009C05067